MPALRQALRLCFAFDRVDYERWLPLYYEDCLALPQTYSAFVEGDFSQTHSKQWKWRSFRLGF